VAGDQLRTEDFHRRPAGNESSAVEQEQTIGVLGGEREIVHRAEHGQAAVAAQLVDQLEGLLAATDVERGRRLVEEQDGRLLREGPRDHRPLALAAGQRPEPSSREGQKVEPGESRSRRRSVSPALGPVVAQVRRPAQQHVLRHSHVRGQRGHLRDEREPAPELPP